MEEGGAKKVFFFRFLGNEMMVLETKCGCAAVGLCRGVHGSCIGRGRSYPFVVHSRSWFRTQT